MNMKITRFALGAKCGCLGERGFSDSAAAKPNLPKRPAKASIPKPQEVAWRTSRRVSGANMGVVDRGRRSEVGGQSSVGISEFGGSKERLADVGPRGRRIAAVLQVGERGCLFIRTGRATEHEAEGVIDACGVVGQIAISQQTLGGRLGLLG